MNNLFLFKNVRKFLIINFLALGVTHAQPLPESTHKNWDKLNSEQKKIMRETGYVFHEVYARSKKIFSAAYLRCERNAADTFSKAVNARLKDLTEKSTSKKEIEKFSEQAESALKQSSLVARSRCIAKNLLTITTLKMGSPSVSVDHWSESAMGFDFDDMTDKAKKGMNDVLLEDYDDFYTTNISYEKLTKSEWASIAKKLNIPASQLETFRPVRAQQYQSSVEAIVTSIYFFPEFFEMKCVEEGANNLLYCYPQQM